MRLRAARPRPKRTSRPSRVGPGAAARSTVEGRPSRRAPEASSIVTSSARSRGLQRGRLNRASRVSAGQAITRSTTRSTLRSRPRWSSYAPTSPTTPRPRSPQIGSLVAKGGRRTQLQDSDLLRMLALRAFRASRAQGLAFAAWLEISRPLARLRSIREILDLGAPPRDEAPIAVTNPRPSGTTQVDLPLASPGVPPPHNRALPRPVRARSCRFTRTPPSRWLGERQDPWSWGCRGSSSSPGSPRSSSIAKGTSRLLRDEAWHSPVDRGSRPSRAVARRHRPASWFTPGTPMDARSGSSSLPQDGRLPEFRAPEEAFHAASALAGMLDYRHDTAPGAKAIWPGVRSVTQAGARLDLDTLVRRMTRRPRARGAVGRLDTRALPRAGSRFLERSASRGELFGTNGRSPRRRLHARGPRGGKTRLTIISTNGSATAPRPSSGWASSSSPSPATSPAPRASLQGVVAIDEADLYSPRPHSRRPRRPWRACSRRARSTGSACCRDAEPRRPRLQVPRTRSPRGSRRVKETDRDGQAQPHARQRARRSRHPHRRAEAREFTLLKDGVATELQAARSCIAPSRSRARAPRARPNRDRLYPLNPVVSVWLQTEVTQSCSGYFQLPSGSGGSVLATRSSISSGVGIRVA